jgi:hypothetical protein
MLPVITPREKELLAQQADCVGWESTAESVRRYLRTGKETPATVIRTSVCASAFGWQRLPGWSVVRPTLPRPSRAARRVQIDAWLKGRIT